MPPWSEVLGNRSIRRQKTLGMAGRFEPLHPILALPRRPMRVLTPVIEIPTLAMFHPGQYLPWLLLDSRVVDVPMAYSSTCVMLSALKSLFFNGLANES